MGLQANSQNSKDEERYQGILRVSLDREVDYRSEDADVRCDHEENDSERDKTQGGSPLPEGEQRPPGVGEEVVPARLPSAGEIDLQGLGCGVVVSQPHGLDREANQDTDRQDVADDRLQVTPPDPHAVTPWTTLSPTLR